MELRGSGRAEAMKAGRYTPAMDTSRESTGEASKPVEDAITKA